MGKTNRALPHDDWSWYRPQHRVMHVLGDMNPSSSYRKMWRRLHRCRANRALRSGWKTDDLQVPVKLRETTSIFDWY